MCLLRAKDMEDSLCLVELLPKSRETVNKYSDSISCWRKIIMIKGMIGRIGLLLLRNIEVRNGICVES